TRQVEAREVDPALRNLVAAAPDTRALSETPPSHRHLQAFRAVPQIIQVELEDVVPLERVRILFCKDLIQSLEQGALGGIVHLFEHERSIAIAEAQPDRDDPVLRVGRIGESALRRCNLDVQLTAPKLVKTEVAEQPPASLQQVLAFERPNRVHRDLPASEL